MCANLYTHVPYMLCSTCVPWTCEVQVTVYRRGLCLCVCARSWFVCVCAWSWFVCVCVCVWLYVCVCVCVCERDRGRAICAEGSRDYGRESPSAFVPSQQREQWAALQREGPAQQRRAGPWGNTEQLPQLTMQTHSPVYNGRLQTPQLL